MDNHWREHLSAMDYLRQGIHLRGYAQKDPKQEYKREAFELFTTFLDNLKFDIVKLLLSVDVSLPEDVNAVEEQRRSDYIKPLNMAHPVDENILASDDDTSAITTFRRDPQKVGRNDPCPCGSHKKYKLCHGRLS